MSNNIPKQYIIDAKMDEHNHLLHIHQCTYIDKKEKIICKSQDDKYSFTLIWKISNFTMTIFFVLSAYVQVYIYCDSYNI